MFGTIKLTQGKEVLVDKENFDILNKYKWFAHKRGNYIYACRSENGKTIQMHSVIAKTPKGLETDHIDGDTLNNQKKNLRVCTKSQNQHNRKISSNNKSGFKGVSYNKKNKKWQADIQCNGVKIYLGYFNNKLNAYKAYCDACLRYHGNFTNLTR